MTKNIDEQQLIAFNNILSALIKDIKLHYKDIQKFHKFNQEAQEYNYYVLKQSFNNKSLSDILHRSEAAELGLNEYRKKLKEYNNHITYKLIQHIQYAKILNQYIKEVLSIKNIMNLTKSDQSLYERGVLSQINKTMQLIGVNLHEEAIIPEKVKKSIKEIENTVKKIDKLSDKIKLSDTFNDAKQNPSTQNSRTEQINDKLLKQSKHVVNALSKTKKNLQQLNVAIKDEHDLSKQTKRLASKIIDTFGKTKLKIVQFRDKIRLNSNVTEVNKNQIAGSNNDIERKVNNQQINKPSNKSINNEYKSHVKSAMFNTHSQILSKINVAELNSTGNVMNKYLSTDQNINQKRKVVARNKNLKMKPQKSIVIK